MSRGKIVAAVDHRKAHEEIVNKIIKLQSCAKDTAAEIAQIKRLISEIKF